MSRRRSKSLPVELFRQLEGPDILKMLGEFRRKLNGIRFPIGTPDYRLRREVIERIDDMVELLTGDRTHFHEKMYVPPSSATEP